MGAWARCSFQDRRKLIDSLSTNCQPLVYPAGGEKPLVSLLCCLIHPPPFSQKNVSGLVLWQSLYGNKAALFHDSSWHILPGEQSSTTPYKIKM